MKSFIVILQLFLFFSNGFPQNPTFEYNGRNAPSVNKEKLKEVQFVGDITPQLWDKMALPYKDYYELNQRKKSQGYYNYNTIIDFVSVEISTTSGNKTFTSHSTSDKLTAEQKSILNSADLGSEIKMKIRFKYKIAKDYNGKIIEGEAAVAVVPETEAEYPGGYKQLSTYLTENVINKITGANAPAKLNRAIVKFVVSEQGEIEDAKILSSSSDAGIDKVLLDAIHKMPKWKPAKNAKGIKVKQEFIIPFGGGC
jgi:TonB family protein